MAQGNAVVVRFLGDASALNTVIGRVDGRLGALGRTAVRVAQGVAIAGVAAVATSVSAFVKFDDAMIQSQAIMGDLSDTMKSDMTDAAKEIGRTTRLSATEAAESFFFLASAGLDAEQSMAALPQVAAFAQAGMFDMATATDLATDAQVALGLGVKDPIKNLENLTHVTDVLVGANTLANASVEQFSTALTTNVGAALKVYNKDIEEGAAVLAVFANQGLKGAEAGTSLDIVMRDLNTKARENIDQFKAAGIAVHDAGGDMRNMADIVEDMENAFGGLPIAQMTDEMSKLGFSQRNIKKLILLMGSSGEIRDIEAALRDMGGATQEVADNQLKSLAAQWDLVKGSIESVALSAVEKFKPKMMDALDSVRNWWNANGPAVIDWFDRAFGAIGRWWNETGQAVFSAIGEGLLFMGETAVEGFKLIAGWWDETGRDLFIDMGVKVEEFYNGLIGWWEDHGDSLMGFFVNFGEGVDDAMNILSDWWKDNGDNVQGGFEGLGIVIGEVTDRTDDATDSLGAGTVAAEAYTLAVDSTATFLEIMAESVLIVVDAMTILGTWIGTGISKWEEWGEAAKSGLSTVRDFVVDVGKEIGHMFSNEGLSDAFGGLWTSFRGVANRIIRAWNDIGFEGFTVNIPGAGPQTFGGFDVPNIDLIGLAKGGVVQPRDPFMALLGDNNREREIVTPESLMREVVREEMGNTTNNSGAEINIENVNMGNGTADELSDALYWRFNQAGGF